jgi:hypothetical protein
LSIAVLQAPFQALHGLSVTAADTLSEGGDLRGRGDGAHPREEVGDVEGADRVRVG